MDGWGWAWVGWLACFLLLEGSALLSHQPGSTLSEKTWAWFHVRDKRPTALTWVLRGALLLFLAWLLAHLAFGFSP